MTLYVGGHLTTVLQHTMPSKETAASGIGLAVVVYYADMVAFLVADISNALVWLVLTLLTVVLIPCSQIGCF